MFRTTFQVTIEHLVYACTQKLEFPLARYPLLTHEEWENFYNLLKLDNIPVSFLNDRDYIEKILLQKDFPINKPSIEEKLYSLQRVDDMFTLWKQAAFIKPISIYNKHYPKRLKRVLGPKAPMMLYAAGDVSRLNPYQALAIVGSRAVSEENLEATRNYAHTCAYKDVTIISGYAKGVDQIAMYSAKDAVGILPGQLFYEVRTDKYLQDAIRNPERGFTLISFEHPDANWTVNAAHRRNEYIYCMADKVLIVQSENNKGGTWQGATTHFLKNRGIRVPVYLHDDKTEKSGKSALQNKGGILIRTPPEEFIDYAFK